MDVFSLNIKDAESAIVSDLLWEEYQIATRPGYHCAPLMHEALGTADRGTVRLSFSSFTTKAEVDKTLAAIKIWRYAKKAGGLCQKRFKIF